MGLLGEVFSAGDRMKRKLRGLLDDPMGTIALGSQRMSEDVQQMGLLADEAGYLPGTNSVLLTPQQKARARKELADKGAEMALAAATVWHGSPHKFDKFDSSKIGTGEGAQAYGHGLYLAESPGVAKAYKKNLSQGRAPMEMSLDGSPFPDPKINFSNPDPQQQQLARIKTLLLQEGGDVDRAIARTYGDDVAALEKFRGRVSVGEPGNLYKVDLPDDQIAKMLDWDKPLSQQAPEVADAVRKAFPGTYINGRYVDPSNSQLTGKALLDQLTAIANKRGTPGMRQAEPMLREAGIPGIRYLDGGSRGAGQGSSNFVVFPGNEGLLSILERNGAPIK